MTFLVSKGCFSEKNYARKRGTIGLWISILPKERYICSLQEGRKKLGKLLLRKLF
jgi:hypothetical protein